MDPSTRLESLIDQDVVLADTEEDFRGLVVFDAHGHRLGEVDDQVVDAATGVTRFVVVESGGLLPMSSVRRLIPVEVIDRVGPAIRVLRSVEHVRQGAPIVPVAWADTRVVRQVHEHYQLLDPAELDGAGRAIA